MDTPRIYAENPPDSITIKLAHPIHIGEERIAELCVRPMNAGDQRRMKTEGNLPLPMVAELAMYLTGQPQEVIDEVTGVDLGKLNTAVLGFFTSSQSIGEEPSES
jgi:hypothetical protein